MNERNEESPAVGSHVKGLLKSPPPERGWWEEVFVYFWPSWPYQCMPCTCDRICSLVLEANVWVSKLIHVCRTFGRAIFNHMCTTGLVIWTLQKNKHLRCTNAADFIENLHISRLTNVNLDRSALIHIKVIGFNNIANKTYCAVIFTSKYIYIFRQGKSNGTPGTANPLLRVYSTALLEDLTQVYRQTDW